MDEQRDTSDFDAYGDRLPGLRMRADSPFEQRVRRLGIAVFWSLALLIVAGRVHYGPVIGAATTHPIEIASR